MCLNNALKTSTNLVLFLSSRLRYDCMSLLFHHSPFILHSVTTATPTAVSHKRHQGSKHHMWRKADLALHLTLQTEQGKRNVPTTF
jgi:hypothetical protein